MKPARIASAIALCIVLTSLTVFLWAQIYPEPYDPKNIGYVLWKHGLNQHMDMDAALGGMSHDVSPVSIVKGMTKEQLKGRFGYIQTRDEVSGYLSLCSLQPAAIELLRVKPESKEVVFLRSSPWMVILENGKAADLLLCKGY